MPQLPFRFVFLHQQLAGSPGICSLLANPAIARLVESDGSIPDVLIDRAIEFVQELPASSHYQTTFPGELHLANTVLRVDAPANSQGWHGSFEFPVHYTWWNIGDRYQVAFIPGVGVKAIAVGGAQIENEVRREMRSAMQRTGATTQLGDLNQLARFANLELQFHEQPVSIGTPREIADRSNLDDDKPATLKQVGLRLVPGDLPIAWFVENEVKQLAGKLSGNRPESVLLVGPSGAGKTAIFHQMIRDADDQGMSEVEFWQTDGSRLIAGMSGFGQWQERCTSLVNELEKKKSVIHFGNLVELVEVGRGGGGTQGIADFMRPFMLRGKILAVAECTAEQLSLINKQSPQLLDAFHQIRIAAPDHRKTGEILLEIAAHDPSLVDKVIDPAAITKINQLHARYATCSAMPGRAIRFFRNLVDDAPPESIVDANMVTDAFSDETGLPRFLLRDNTPLDLSETQTWFADRIIGQTGAVDLVSDLLAVVKSNLNRPGRPIASLMFVGPTGVGKTQMAKALAEFMYRDEKELVRFDMSEYRDPLSAVRLIGGLGEGDGLLTGKIRENPFTVLLLDEFEKAHSSVFDLLLQVLGEGRLTDGRGRLVDFSTCIIIMTSNLGVDSFREVALGFGERDNHSGYEDHFVNKVRQFVRPEFFNRIDRVVPFAPLSIEVVEQIARRELELVKKRFGIATRRIEFRIHKSVPVALAEAGYDARYGARPLKRAINRRLIQPLSRQLARRSSGSSLIVKVHAQKTGIHFVVESAETTAATRKSQTTTRQLLYNLSKTRRRAQAMTVSPAASRIRNVTYRQQQSLQRALKRTPASEREARTYRDPRLLELQMEIQANQHLIERAESILDELLQFERQVVLNTLTEKPVDNDELMEVAESANSDIDKMILELFLTESEGEKRVTLVAFGRHPDLLQGLVDSWLALASRYEFKSQVYELRRISEEDRKPHYVLPYRKESDADRSHVLEVFAKIPESPPKDLVGYAVTFEGEASFQIFLPEKGLHRFRQNGTRDVLVETTGKQLRNYDPPRGIEKLPKFEEAKTRRTYDLDAKTIKDVTLSDPKNYEDGELAECTADIVDICFRKLLNSRIETWN